MKNFAQPVSMPCTEEQYNRDLKEALEKLGYKLVSTYGWDRPSIQYLVTNWSGRHNETGNIQKQEVKQRNRHFIPDYNPKLFLAIAGMRKGEVHVGEWMMCLEDTSTGGKKGNLYQVFHISNLVNSNYPRINHFGENFSGNEFWRKATLSELISHFAKQEKIMEHEFKFGDEVVAGNNNNPARYNMIYVGRLESNYPYLTVDNQADITRLKSGDYIAVKGFQTVSFRPKPITRNEIKEKFNCKDFVIVD